MNEKPADYSEDKVDKIKPVKQPESSKGCLKGCLIGVLIMIVLVTGGGYMISLIMERIIEGGNFL